MPPEWTGRHKPMPRFFTPCLPLRGSVRRIGKAEQQYLRMEAVAVGARPVLRKRRFGDDRPCSP